MKINEKKLKIAIDNVRTTLGIGSAFVLGTIGCMGVYQDSDGMKKQLNSNINKMQVEMKETENKIQDYEEKIITTKTGQKAKVMLYYNSFYNRKG